MSVSSLRFSSRYIAMKIWIHVLTFLSARVTSINPLPIRSVFALEGNGQCRVTFETSQKESGCSESVPVEMGEPKIKSEVPITNAGRVIVVGGGLAGLSASIEILRTGGSVIIIEKGERLGGNSAKASSGMNAAGSSPQAALLVQDKPKDLVQDTLRSGKGLSGEELVSVLAEKSGSAVDFLESFGVDLSTLSQLGGHSHPRTHRSKPDGKPANVGWRIMSSLISFIESLPAEKVTLLKKTRAVDLIVAPGEGPDGGDQVVGVKCQTQEDGQEREVEVRAGAVVLATGGFGSDRDGLLAKHKPSVRHLATTNGPFATGDGVKMAEKIGAGLVHMEQVQIHPSGFVDLKDPANPTKFLAPEALRGSGGILLNSLGTRFVNELSTRDAVVERILANCEPLPESLAAAAGADLEGIRSSGRELPIASILLLTEAGIEMFGRSTASFYAAKGLMKRFENAKELCQEWRLPEAAVEKTFSEYGEGGTDAFGKQTFLTKFRMEDPLWAAVVTPVLHYCMGGLQFDSYGRILRSDGTNIPGLYGAGEVTGGLHGANRLAGNSLLECVVFGRIAGSSALDFASRTSLPL